MPQSQAQQAQPSQYHHHQYQQQQQHNSSNSNSDSGNHKPRNHQHHLEHHRQRAPANDTGSGGAGPTGVGYNPLVGRNSGGGGGGNSNQQAGRRTGADSASEDATSATASPQPPLGRLNGLRGDSFTLIDANGPTVTQSSPTSAPSKSTPPARPNGSQHQQGRPTAKTVSPTVGGDGRDNQADNQDSGQSRARQPSGHSNYLSVGELQAHRFKLKTLAAGEQNNNTILTPIGSLAAALRMDNLNNNGNSKSNLNGSKTATSQGHSPTGANNQAATNTSQNGQHQAATPVGGGLMSKLMSQQQQPTSQPNYTSLFNQQQQQSLTKSSTTFTSTTTTSAAANDSYRRPRWPGLTPLDSMSKAQAKDAVATPIQVQQQQQPKVPSPASPLKKQIALDLGEQTSVLLSKKSASIKRNATNYSPPSRGSKSKLVVETRDYDYMSNDDNDDELDAVKKFGIDNSDHEGDYMDEEEDEETEDDGEQEEEDEDEEEEDDDDDDERLPFNGSTNLLASNTNTSKNSSRLMSLRQQEGSGIAGNKKSANKLIGATNLATNYSHRYPGSATKNGSDIRRDARGNKQQVTTKTNNNTNQRADKKIAANCLLNSAPSYKSRHNLHPSNHHQQQNARISLSEISRPPSFNSCQQQKQQSGGRECRKLDLLEQAACLNCNCNSCSKKRKLANQNGGLNYQQVAKVGNTYNPHLIECGYAKARYPKTHICHLILKCLVLILCFLLLLLLLVGLVMLSIHMPRAFENALNAPHTFNVTIAG